GNAVREDATSGVRPAVSPVRDEDFGGRGGGTAAVPAGDQPVSDVPGSDDRGAAGPTAPGPFTGGGGSAAATTADDPTVAGGPEVGTADRDGLSVDGRPRDGTDPEYDQVAGVGQSDDGGLRSRQRLAGVAADWSGETFRPSGFQARFDANIAALETLQALENDSAYATARSEEHTSELQSRFALVCPLVLEKKNKYNT